MATDIKEFFSKFFDWSNVPQRLEVYNVLEQATNGFQKGRCEALLYDLEWMVEDWKYQQLCDRINRENEFRAEQVDEAFRLYEQAFVNDGEWGRAYEEYERLKQELVPLLPPIPGADTSTIPTPPIFEYAMSLLCHDGEEPPRQAATAAGQDDEAATPSPVQLPKELDSDEARGYFRKAIELGLMNEQYKWLLSKALFACFSREMSYKLDLGKGINNDGTKRLSLKPFETLFNYKKGSLRGALNDIKKTGQDPKGIEKVDAIFKE